MTLLDAIVYETHNFNAVQHSTGHHQHISMEKQIVSTWYEEEFLVEFECPVCTKYMFPPIKQCLTGHSFCQNCFQKMRRCALCRAPKSEGRCYVLEKVHAYVTFPCAYTNEGCNFQGKGDLISIHQKNCKYFWCPCPLRFNKCEWQGEKSDLVTHCKTEHSGNTFFKSKQKFLSSSFINRMDRIYYIVFYVYGNIFRCTWDLDKETGKIRFAVYYMGKSMQQDRFGFQMSYMSQDNEIVSVKAPCYAMEDDSEPFLKDKYFLFHYEQVKHFCDEDGDLNYSVNIFQKK